MSKPFTDIPGKEGLLLTVTYPPSGADEIHRRDAHRQGFRNGLYAREKLHNKDCLSRPDGSKA